MVSLKSFTRKKVGKHQERGKLIAIEGIEGSGKAAQIKMLTESLTFAGFTVAIAEFPQKLSIASGLIQKYKTNGLLPEAAAIFYATDHFEAKNKLVEWLAKGTIILTTGYASSIAAKQGSLITGTEQRIKFFRWVHQLEHQIFGLPQPELNIILNAPAGLAQMAAGGPAKASAGDVVLQEEAFSDLAKIYPQTKLVSCAGKERFLPAQTVHNVIWELVRRVALKNRLATTHERFT